MTTFNHLLLHKDGLNRVPAAADDLSVTLNTISFTTELALTGGASVSGDMSIGGNLDVAGNIVARDEERVLVQDNFLDVNFGYTGTTFESGGIAVNYKAVSGLNIDASSDNLTFAAQAGGNPAKVTGTSLQIPASTFSDGDIIQIHGTTNAENDGFYVVDGANSATEIVFKTSPNFQAAQVDVTSETDAGSSITIFKVNVTSLQVDSAGIWKTATGASDSAFATGSLNDLGSSSLQEGYELGNEIDTDGTNGDVVIKGTQKLDVQADGGLEVLKDAVFSAAASVGGVLTASGESRLNGGIKVATNKFVVASATGNTDIAGDLAVTGAGDINGNFSVATDKFTVAAATGNTAVDGTLGVAGAATMSSTLGVSGAATMSSTLDVTGAGEFDSSLGADGDFRVGAAGGSKFTVAAATGNTAVAGSLTASGAATMSSTLDVTGAADLASTLNVQAKATLASAAVSDLTVAGGLVFSDANGNLDDDSALTFASGVLSSTDLQATSIGDEQIVFSDANGKLHGDSNFRYDGSNLDIGADGSETFRVNVSSGSTTVKGNLSLHSLTRMFDGSNNVTFSVNSSGVTSIANTLDVTGLASLDGGIDVNSAKFTVSANNGDTSVAGELTAASATVSDLTAGRVVLAGTAGAIEDSGNLTFDGTDLAITGNVDASGSVAAGNMTIGSGSITDDSGAISFGDENLSTTGSLSVLSAAVTDLTEDQIVLAGSGGELEGDAKFTFHATNGLLVDAAAKVTGALDLDGSIDADLTGDMDVEASGRIVLESAGSDDPNAPKDSAIHLRTTQNQGSITLESATGITLKAPNKSIDIEGATVFGYAGCVTMINNTGGTLSAGTVVRISGYDTTNNMVEMSSADQSAGSNHHPIGILIAEAADGEMRPVHTVPGTTIDNLTFAGSPSEGDALYLDGTNISASAPTGGTVYRLGYCTDSGGGMILSPQFIAQFG